MIFRVLFFDTVRHFEALCSVEEYRIKTSLFAEEVASLEASIRYACAGVAWPLLMIFRRSICLIPLLVIFLIWLVQFGNCLCIKRLQGVEALAETYFRFRCHVKVFLVSVTVIIATNIEKALHVLLLVEFRGRWAFLFIAFVRALILQEIGRIPWITCKFFVIGLEDEILLVSWIIVKLEVGIS